MSQNGGWEVVGKNKKDKAAGGKNGKLSKAEKKKFIDNAPRVEDFLPLDQVKTLYDNLGGNKDNKKVLKEKANKTKENEEKQKKQKQNQHSEKKKEDSPKISPKPPKEKQPKTLEEALKMISVTEMQTMLSSNKTSFPDAPLLWLKNLGAYLNSKITIDKDDPMFTGKPDNYPLNLVPQALYSLCEKVIQDAGPATVKLFYEYIFTAITIEMGKGAPVVGYKILIQLLAKYDPKLSVSNIQKLINMRNSYQNRKPIGLTLLWCFNQGGKQNLSVGLKVWQEVMAPMMEAKSYCSNVMKILTELVKTHLSTEENLQFDSYFSIYEAFFSGKYNLSQQVVKEGFEICKTLRVILLNNKTLNHKKVFDAIFPLIQKQTTDELKTELVNILTLCLGHDDRCFAAWKSLYMKNLCATALLLSHIETNWNKLTPALNPKVVTEVIETFLTTHEKRTTKGKGKEDKYLALSIGNAKTLARKMAEKKAKKGGFRWKTICLLLLLLIGGFVAYDSHKYGSFGATSTGKFMRETGISDFAEKSWNTTKALVDDGFKKLESTSPEHYKMVKDFFAPYVKLTGDFYRVVQDVAVKQFVNIATYISDTRPLVAAKIEEYAPGLLDSVQTGVSKAMNAMKNAFIFMVEQIIENTSLALRYLKTNVFVGKLSPESLQNYASLAINRTHIFASQTYDWVYEKVQTFSKVN
ncbi:transmembrane protein 214-B [Trichogramma pretiosum]|uniref:transmembrane protein 214-B n=1 Tax=Trichogramma pretiosum TaxID=7493 RepID=UPI0006C96C1B|nr:transmembrane protein 214-B [Trichogramma pretiosum]